MIIKGDSGPPPPKSRLVVKAGGKIRDWIKLERRQEAKADWNRLTDCDIHRVLGLASWVRDFSDSREGVLLAVFRSSKPACSPLAISPSICCEDVPPITRDPLPSPRRGSPLGHGRR
jgi:hypothetical protein